MNESKLGQLIDETAARDAIHIAIAPVVAMQHLLPGQEIGFVPTGQFEKVGLCTEPIGIVDPYLKQGPIPGERFWLCLFPQTTTGLRHVWTHPAFLAEIAPPNANWRAIIECEASNAGLSYDEMMAGARDFALSGDCLCEGNRWDCFSMLDCERFWDAYEAITGEKPKWRGSFFSCSC